MNRLLAKSRPPMSLHDHLQDVRESGAVILQMIGGDLFQAGVRITPRLCELLSAACLLHDVMKANSAFQQMVQTSGPPQKQPIRHEALAAVLLGVGTLANWFAQVLPDPSERWAVIWAVAGHHLQMGRDLKDGLVRDTENRHIVVYLDHTDVKTALAKVERGLDCGSIAWPRSELRFDTADDDEGLRVLARRFLRESRKAWDNLCDGQNMRGTVALLKGLLIAADVAGSAIAERQLSLSDWIRSALASRLKPIDLVPVINKGTRGKPVLPFQQSVGESKLPVTLVAAGCGNGKTTAAYLWAQRHAAEKKLFFTYPTTGTATAGYVGYLADQHQLLADLIHMRSAVDLEAIRGTPEDRSEESVRIESLRVWDRKVIVCTVDTVLGLLQTQRRAMYSLPAILAGAFVFDEIHSYDSKLFGGLLRFLQEFPGISCLIMSASIPPGRLTRLKDALGKRVGKVIEGDPILEGHKRYRMESRTNAASCWPGASAALKNNKKVLWVCNTVGDAIRTARESAQWTDVKPVIYHSRFRYKDRVDRQNVVLAEFAYDDKAPDPKPRKKLEPGLVIATQVCEMSLDISADLLVTAECPLPALVQRLGRLNRYASGDDPWPCFVYAFKGLPYNENPTRVDLDGDCIASMQATRDAIAQLAGKPISQRDLAERLDLMDDAEEPETYSALFDDGWITEPMPVRDGDQSITVVRQADLSEIDTKHGKDRTKWSARKLAPWTIPMNFRRGLAFNEYAGPYLIATDDMLEYTEAEGGQWK